MISIMFNHYWKYAFFLSLSLSLFMGIVRRGLVFSCTCCFITFTFAVFVLFFFFFFFFFFFSLSLFLSLFLYSVSRFGFFDKGKFPVYFDEASFRGIGLREEMKYWFLRENVKNRFFWNQVCKIGKNVLQLSPLFEALSLPAGKFDTYTIRYHS
jgi:hypothetical protein